MITTVGVPLIDETKPLRRRPGRPATDPALRNVLITIKIDPSSYRYLEALRRTLPPPEIGPPQNFGSLGNAIEELIRIANREGITIDSLTTNLRQQGWTRRDLYCPWCQHQWSAICPETGKIHCVKCHRKRDVSQFDPQLATTT